MNSDMVSYYSERAKEYEKIYSKPERQNDLLTASGILQKTFKGKDVFEIACGTGYWTEKIAKAANTIHATDINETVLEIAKQKNYGNTKVSFAVADIFNNSITENYEGLFAGFIWSHIALQDIDHFLKVVNGFVKPNGTVVFMDNIFVAGSSSPITYKDDEGNTFQTRVLENKTKHQVLKNFPKEEYLMDKLQEMATNVSFIKLEYFWIFTYQVT